MRQIIKPANHLMCETISGDIARGDLAENDDKYRHLLEKSVEQGMEDISIDGQRLRFRWPMTAAMFKDALMDDDLADAIAQFRKAAGVIHHANDLLTVELGKVDAEVTALQLILPPKKSGPMPSSRWTPNTASTVNTNRPMPAPIYSSA